MGQDTLATQLPDDRALPIPVSSCWLPGQRRPEGASTGQLTGIAKSPAGFFKVLLGRRAMRLWPRATPRERETEELAARLFLRAEVPGKEDVVLGPFMVNRGTGPLGMKG